MDDAKRGEKRGRGRPALRTGPAHQFLMRLPEDLYRQLKIYAAAQGLSLNDLVLKLIGDAWSRTPQRETFVRLAAKTPAAVVHLKGSKTKVPGE
jgi:hypothetical protein